MVSVLGKRARPHDSTEERVKRRARLDATNDENVDPLSSNAALHASSKHSHSVVAKSHEAEEVENLAQLPTPKTPRHRDALTKRLPITPRHRVGINCKLGTPRTPRTSQTPLNVPTVYHSARQLFTRSADPGRIVGREKEREELQRFLEAAASSTDTGRSIYLSGPPGTGKSAVVSEVYKGVKVTATTRAAYINCMSIKSPEELYNRLADQLLDTNVFGAQNVAAELRSIFLPRKKSCSPTYVVTLDEMDHLLTTDLDMVYSLFEWSLQKSSRLIIIGIANALDLTDRFLPRLKARNFKPHLLPFLPYTASQIESIITSKLRSLMPEGPKEQQGFVPFIHPEAIQLCSKKVASQNGDLRKAFDIIRRTIDSIETDIKARHHENSPHRLGQNSPSNSPLGENPNLASPSPINSKQPANFLNDLTSLTAPRATIAHVSRIAAASLSNGTSQRLRTLNLQQKAALCALISHQKLSRRTSSSIFATPTKLASLGPTPKKLHETYSSLCKQDNALHPLTLTEFSDVISGLETLGLVGEDAGRSSLKVVTPRKQVRYDERCLLSFVDEKEIWGCWEGVQGSILRSLVLDENR